MDLPKYTLSNFIIIGDRVLIRPETKSETKSGLYLPPSVYEKESIQTGRVVKVGPGYPLGSPSDYDEPYKEVQETVRYIPLQVQEGDIAVYLQKQAYEIEFNEEKYVIVPQSAVLMLVRGPDSPPKSIEE